MWTAKGRDKGIVCPRRSKDTQREGDQEITEISKETDVARWQCKIQER